MTHGRMYDPDFDTWYSDDGPVENKKDATIVSEWYWREYYNGDDDLFKFVALEQDEEMRLIGAPMLPGMEAS